MFSTLFFPLKYESGVWIWPPHPADPQSKHKQSCSLKSAQRAYGSLVRRPGQEDPLISLIVGGIQPVQYVAGHIILKEGQHKAIVLLVPCL